MMISQMIFQIYFVTIFQIICDGDIPDDDDDDDDDDNYD